VTGSPLSTLAATSCFEGKELGGQIPFCGEAAGGEEDGVVGEVNEKLYSTPEDLLIFDQAIFNHTILNQATVDTMLTPYKNLEGTALGFWVYPKKFGNVNTLFAERQGGGEGFHSNWVRLIDKKLTFILLANTDAVDLNSMRLRIIAAYLGQ